VKTDYIKYHTTVDKIIQTLDKNPGKEALDRLAKTLDNLAGHYVNDEELGSSRYKMYQAQAMMLYYEGEWKWSLEVIEYAIQLRGHSYELAEQLIEHLEQHVQSDKQKERHTMHDNYSDLARDWPIWNWPEPVRWLLILPAALLGSIIIPAVVYGLAMSGGDDPSGGIAAGSIADIGLRLLQAVAFGGLFVYIGAAFAPRKQLYTAFAMFLLLIPLLALIAWWVVGLPQGIAHNMTETMWFFLVNIVVGYLGGAGAVAYVYRELG